MYPRVVFQGRSRRETSASIRSGPLAQAVDPGTAVELLRRLAFNGIRVSQLDRDVRYENTTFPRGTWVIPMDQEFGELARDFAAAGLEFAAPARAVDTFDRLNFTAPQRAMFDGLDLIAREEVKDRLLARKFRRDYFRKIDGARQVAMSPESERIMLARASIEVDDLAAGASAVRIDPVLVRHIVTGLGAGPTSIASLITDVHARDSVLECVAALMRAECVVPVGAADSQDTRVAREVDCRTLNARLLDLSRRQVEASVLASPLTKAGVEVDRVTLRFLDLWQQGVREIDALVREVTLAGEDDEDLRARATEFVRSELPHLARLQIGVAFDRALE